jgi:hypothetical protein
MGAGGVAAGSDAGGGEVDDEVGMGLPQAAASARSATPNPTSRWVPSRWVPSRGVVIGRP